MPFARRAAIAAAATLFAGIAGIAGIAGAAAHADGHARTPRPVAMAAPAPTPEPGGGRPAVSTEPDPAATTQPTPVEIPVSTSTPDGCGGHGLFDIGGRIRDSINCWFHTLAVDALNPLLAMLGRSVMATPDVTGPGQVHDMWLLSVGVANAVFVVLLLIGGLVAMGYETVQTRYAVKDLLPRIVVAWVAANASLELAHLAISTANGLSQAFLGAGVDPDTAAEGLKRLAIESITGGPLHSLLALALVVLTIALLGVYVVRVATVVVLVAGAPLCLIAHVLPSTNGAARMWWRALAGCLGVQVAQSFVLITATRVFFDVASGWPFVLAHGGLMDLIVCGAFLWLLLRIPSYAGRLVFGSTGGNAATKAVKYVVISRGVGAVMRAGR